MIPGSANALLLASAAEAGAYQVSRSVRFNSADSAYLSRTPASAGNRKTWTWAGWVKVSALSGTSVLFGVTTGTTDSTWNTIRFVNGYLRFNVWTTEYRISSAVFRDFSAWYHVVVALDTTAAAADDRVKLYVNGTQITDFGTNNTITQNADLPINSAAAHTIGASTSTSQYFDGYLADVHLVDGQALDPTSFTETDATTGQLIPKAYTGSYGTNGFHLPFSDNSTAAALGTDTSGNSNTWTVNNISVAAGAGNDSLVDTPSSTGVDAGNGGEVRGNYCTWNPLDNAGTLANGNLDFSNSASSNQAVRSTFAVSESGKWYAEFTTGTLTSGSSGVAFGFANSSASLTAGPSAVNRWTIYADAVGYIFANNSTLTSSLGTFAAGTVLQIAYDASTGKAWVGKNNTWYNSSGGTTGDPAAGTNQTFTLSGTQFLYTLCFANSGVLNAGARPFAYAAPSGFKALCDTNLPAPVVAQPSTVMDVKLYTGNGGTQSITGLGFSPSLVWYKSRNNVGNHALFDVVRGATKRLVSNDTAAEDTRSGVTSFDSNGWTEGSFDNQSGYTYVGWAWDAGSSTVTNTQGSITSSVRANASAGFSIVSYTGNNGSSGTVGHGLNAKPSMFIVKNRDVTGDDWVVYHESLGATKRIKLNLTNAADTNSSQFNDTEPTSSVFTVGSLGNINDSYDYIAYCFAPVAGYSAFGSYTGNGSADGPFVYTGFRPRWILLKKTSDATDALWVLYDTARDIYNASEKYLLPNSSNPEGSALYIDVLSNGFKLRQASNQAINYSGATYIYCAFAESPFAYSRAR